jgi:exodeoxyribonuclease VII small subunit
MKNESSEPKEIDFEQSLKRLEEVVELLEKGETPLEESIRLFHEGMKLVQSCSKKLDWAEQQVEMLLETSGEIEKKPFQPEEDMDD